MIHRHRTAVFFLFVITFLVTTGTVLFYTYGFRFNTERGIFIYTGSLSLKTNIETVAITIDGVPIPKKKLGILNNSIQIAGLNPGEHFIEVSAPGYRPWSKKIVIQSGLATEFWNIFLTEEQYEQTSIPATEQVIKMFPAPNGLFATVKQTGDRYSVDVLDIGGNKNIEVFATNDAVFVPSLETNIEWSPESHKLIIPLVKNDTPVYAIIDIETKEVVFLNEAVGISSPLRSPRWDATTENFLFFTSDDALYRYDTSTRNRYEHIAPVELVAPSVAAYDLSGDRLYFLQSTDGIVYEINGHGDRDTPQPVTTLPIIIDHQSPYSLIVYDETRLAIIEENTGTLSVFNKKAPSPLRALGSGIKSLQYSDDGKKLLFFTDTEISVYFNQDWEAQPARAQDSIIQVGRFSAPIQNVQWAEDYEHVIFSLGTSVKLIELDNRDRRGISDLLVLESDPLQLLSRFGTDTLYVINKSPTDALLGNTVFSITLPQFTTLFGR
jgi:hypothetical protein